jgi:hypothetical protein
LCRVFASFLKKRKKKQMPSVQILEEYVDMIGMMDSRLRVQGKVKNLLMAILDMVTECKDFERSIDDIVALFKRFGLHKQKAHLNRQLLFLVPDVDFRIVPLKRRYEGKGGSAGRRIFLSCDGLKRILLHTRTPVQRILERYFFLVEQEFRQDAFQMIEKRLLSEDPLITSKKRNFLRSEIFPIGFCVYLIGLYDQDGNLVHLKEGWCHDLNTRFPRLQKQYYAFEVRVLYQKLTGKNNSLAVEQCSLSSTPEELRSPFDQEVIDTDIGEAIASINDSSELLAEMAQRRHARYLAKVKTGRNAGVFKN